MNERRPPRPSLAGPPCWSLANEASTIVSTNGSSNPQLVLSLSLSLSVCVCGKKWKLSFSVPDGFRFRRSSGRPPFQSTTASHLERLPDAVVCFPFFSLVGKSYTVCVCVCVCVCVLVNALFSIAAQLRNRSVDLSRDAAPFRRPRDGSARFHRPKVFFLSD